MNELNPSTSLRHVFYWHVLLARFMAATDTEIECRPGASQAMVTEMAKFADGPGQDIFPVPIFS